MLGWTLPIHYFHLVFTVPHELEPLLLAHRGVLYNLLFAAAAKALTEMAAEVRGIEPGFVMVPHSWGQEMEHHPHVHCVCTGGGLSLDGQRWIATAKSFFLDVVELGRRFRREFLRGLDPLWCQGKLPFRGKLEELNTPGAWLSLMQSQGTRDWVVHCQPPPQDCPDASAALKYLARYVVGTAISDRRILADDGEYVTIAIKNYRKGGRSESRRMTGAEFVRRFLLHILPRGFVRVRYYGLLAHPARKERLEHCRRLLATKLAPPNATSPNPKAQATETTRLASDPPVCPRCESKAWNKTREDRRPPWHEVSRRQPVAILYDTMRHRARPPT
jgi:hypothetical protein